MFGLLKEASGASDDDLFSTFNMGLGMVLVAPPSMRSGSWPRRRTARSGSVVVAGAGVRITD